MSRYICFTKLKHLIFPNGGSIYLCINIIRASNEISHKMVATGHTLQKSFDQEIYNKRTSVIKLHLKLAFPNLSHHYLCNQINKLINKCPYDNYLEQKFTN
jgi:hypothetical protein